MRIRHELHYDALPDEVYAMLVDPGFRNEVCEAMAVVSCDVSLDVEDDRATVRVERVQSSEGAPGFARRLAGDRTRLVQEEAWRGGRSADLEVTAPGMPAHVRGRMRLDGDATTGTVQVFEGEATVRIPLVGGRLEALVQKYFVEGMDTEQRVGAAWLERKQDA